MNDDQKKFTAILDEDLYQAFHLECVRQDIAMTEVVRGAVRSFLDQNDALPESEQSDAPDDTAGHGVVNA